MDNAINPTTALLNAFKRIAVTRGVSPDLLPLQSLDPVIRLAELYTKPSRSAFAYLEIPLEAPEDPDVHLCNTEALQVPELALHRKLLNFGQTIRSEAHLDFAFDAGDGYRAAPGVYLYFHPAYRPELALNFFDTIGMEGLGRRCTEIIARAPEEYLPYYVGLMPNRQPVFARIGFGHHSLENAYKADIDRFIQDIRRLGYENPIDARMKSELAEAARFDFLRDTQLSLLPDGSFMDRLGMSSVYQFQDRSFPALELLHDDERRQFLEAELNKCCFASKTWTVGAAGVPVPLAVRGFIHYIKCTWVGGERQPLKAYLVLQAKPLKQEG